MWSIFIFRLTINTWLAGGFQLGVCDRHDAPLCKFYCFVVRIMRLRLCALYVDPKIHINRNRKTQLGDRGKPRELLEQKLPRSFASETMIGSEITVVYRNNNFLVWKQNVVCFYIHTYVLAKWAHLGIHTSDFRVNENLSAIKEKNMLPVIVTFKISILQTMNFVWLIVISYYCIPEIYVHI